MTDHKFIELVNKYIDNELNSDETAFLNEYLMDIRRKEFFDSFCKTMNSIENIEKPEYTESVFETIISDLEPIQKESFIDKMKNWINELFEFKNRKLAYSFVLGGVFFAIILVTFIPESNIDNNLVVGTMAEESNKLKDNFKIGSISGENSIEVIDNSLIVNLNIITEDTVDFKIKFDKAFFKPAGLKSSDITTDYDLINDYIYLKSITSGSLKISLDINKKENTSIETTLIREDKEIYSNNFKIIY